MQDGYGCVEGVYDATFYTAGSSGLSRPGQRHFGRPGKAAK